MRVIKNFKYITFIILLFALLGSQKILLSQSSTPWVAPAEAERLINAYNSEKNLTDEAAILYKQLCAMCHGNKGKGDGIGGISLNPKPSNFTKSELHIQSDGALYWKILNGRPPMAGYKSILSEKQIWGLVNYIRTLKKD